MKFSKEDLTELVYGGAVVGNLLTIKKDGDGDKHRWYTIYDLIFMDVTTDKFYMTHYKVGNTEYQEAEPFDDYSEDEIECKEVFKKEKVITVYE
jgi:hypothetical protein